RRLPTEVSIPVRRVKRIAILGWASLLWDGKPDFDRWHNPWQYDGPSIKLEFSRVLESRLGALTLVIDPENGSTTTTAYCLSTRTHPEDSICDLCSREGATQENIGYVFLGEDRCHSHDKESTESIVTWARNKNIDVVVWTDLRPNFSDKVGQPFSIAAAISYLKALNESGKAKAAEYIWQAPHFVRTPLRSVLQAEPWFRDAFRAAGPGKTGDTWIAALIATAVLLPSAVALITTGVFLLGWAVRYAPLWGLGIGLVSWLIVATRFQEYAKAERAIPSSFDEFQTRLSQLRAQMPILAANSSVPGSASADAARKEALEQIERIDEELKQPGLPW